MNQHLEIERRFLLKSLPDLGSLSPELINIQQFYVSVADGRFRIRKETRPANPEGQKHRYVKTIKTRVDDGINMEYEHDLDEDRFESLKRSAIRWISKKRQVVQIGGGLKWEIDLFDPLLYSLVIAEIELKDIHQPFITPEEIRRATIIEITGKDEFSNYSLAMPYNQ
jgi:CYTH domain-containing protein